MKNEKLKLLCEIFGEEYVLEILSESPIDLKQDNDKISYLIGYLRGHVKNLVDKETRYYDYLKKE